jgi:hypothetical protein
MEIDLFGEEAQEGKFDEKLAFRRHGIASKADWPYLSQPRPSPSSLAHSSIDFSVAFLISEPTCSAWPNEDVTSRQNV